MTGHVICVDDAIGQVQQACERNGYVLLVTADHGNAERMIDEAGKPVTKHTTFRGTSFRCSLPMIVESLTHAPDSTYYVL